MKKLTNKECIAQLQKYYGDSLDYSKVNYVNSRSHITLICPIHGEFQQYANNALRGKGGCPKCKLLFSNKEEFIKLAIKTHGGKYNYDKVNYVNMSTPVIITCPKHGDFQQSPRHHINCKYGCAKCYHESTIKNEKPVKLSKIEKDRILTENWKEQCTKIHNNKYDYTLVENFSTLNSKVAIICLEHGVFYQRAQSHLKGYGCTKCATLITKEKLKLSLQDFRERAIKIHGSKYIYNELYQCILK